MSTGMALPPRVAGLNFHLLNAKRAASSINGKQTLMHLQSF